MVSIYKSENENLFFVNRRVNLRDRPNTKNSIVLRVLEVNALVTLINKKDGWMYIKYSDYVDNLEQYGWVYEKYLSKKVKVK